MAEMSRKKLYTLVFPRRNTEILLGLKKRGFGCGKWNGFGGKVEPGETICQAAVREISEECGLTIEERNLNHMGHLEFNFYGEPVTMLVKVFSTFHFDGYPVESEEMSPKWFDISDVPFKNMWLDDKIWFPNMLKGTFFKGYFWFHGNEKIVKHKLDIITKDELENL